MGMLTIQELPTELLSEIFSYLALEKQLLRNLALQCHCFSLAVRPVLLRNLALTLDERADYLLRFDLLNRSVSENPELGGMVRSLSLDMLRIERSAKGKLHKTVDIFLGRLKALRVLKILDNSDPPCFKPAFLQVNSMSQLNDLTISDGNLTLENMTPYMFLEEVFHLNVLWLRNPTPPTFDLLGWPEAEWSLPRVPENKKAGTSPIELLDFGPIFHLPEPVLKEILSWPTALKRFRGTIPGKDVPGRFGVSKKLSTALSPESISRALSPTKGSLRHLELIDNGCQWPGHDETKMDLRDFKSLTKIDVPSTCFFKNFTYGVKREGMYALLPPSLVELRIMYDLDDCIRPDEEERAPIPTHINFEDRDENFWRAPGGLESSMRIDFLNLGNPRDLKWVLELAENKKNHLPNLKRVSLMERCGMLRSGMYPMNWKLPSTIADAFQDSGLEFRAVMRRTSLGPTFD